MLLLDKLPIQLLLMNALFIRATICTTLFTSFAFCSQMPSSVSVQAKTSAPSVVVTIKPIYGLVAALMQGVATPILLCEGRGSSHTLSLAPSDIRTLSDADLVVWVGDSYEVMMAKPLVKAIKNDQLVTLDKIPGLALYPQRTHGLFPEQGCQQCCDGHHHEHSHDGHHHDSEPVYDDEPKEKHEHTSIDGHFWLDSDNAKICVRAIAAVLIQKWPVYKDIIDQNLVKLERDIDALKIELKAQLATVQDKIALIDHDSLQYVEKQFGFVIKGVLSEEPGMPPSAKHLEKLKNELEANLEENLIKVFFYEGAVNSKAPPLLRKLTEAYSTRLVPLDYVGEQLPKSVDVYQACLRAIAAQIKTGFAQ
jgi:zinc transport system substrate-binding protein